MTPSSAPPSRATQPTMPYTRLGNPLYTPRILRLEPEIGGMFTDYMDMLTLTKWRLTCKTNYDQVSGGLRRSLHTLLGNFTKSPSTLLTIVDKHRGIFGGEFALSFILRDPTYKPSNLEIYSSDFDFGQLCDAIAKDPVLKRDILDYDPVPTTIFIALRRLVAHTLEIHLVNGKSIYIHRSYTSSPAAPLSRSPCTALSNFVTAYGFGCSHPSLTLQRRALLADQETPFLSEVDSTIMSNLRKHNFSLAVSPTEWPEYRSASAPADLGMPSGFLNDFGEDEPESDTRSQPGLLEEDDGHMLARSVSLPADPPHVSQVASSGSLSTVFPSANPIAAAAIRSESSLSLTTTTQPPLLLNAVEGTTPTVSDTFDIANEGPECWRHRFVCPSQGRYFGDRGSFVDFFDPLAGDRSRCVENNIAPFGPMVVWRVMSSFECLEDCQVYDQVLEQGVTSLPVLFKDDPYVELRDVVSDRYKCNDLGTRDRGWYRSVSI